MYIKTHCSVETQTDVDPLYDKAESIVNNFDSIEAHWKRAELRNHLITAFCCSVLILIIRKLP